uniref:C2H2-type domain-containing protein n=1 Tax=Strongyloides venezuelensis TaxID=75913 RepID=A0A0K0FUW2_STRVS
MSMISDNSFYCFICNKVFTSDERRYQHFEKHIDYSRFKCRECDSHFSSYDDLECHQECLQHFDFEKATNLGIRKLITLLAELSLKIEDFSDMDIVKFSVTVKTNNSKISDSESGISKDSVKKTIDNGEPEGESLISNIKTEVINSITVEKDNNPNSKDSNDSGRSSVSSNTVNVKENIDKPIKMKRSEYLCSEILKRKRFKKNSKLKNECLYCKKNFGSGEQQIEHVLRNHMMLKEFKLLECMYCLNQKGKSIKFLDISSVQEHYKNTHKVSKNGCPNNLAWDYSGKEKYICVNGNTEFLAEYEARFAECFVEKVGKKKKS